MTSGATTVHELFGLFIRSKIEDLDEQELKLIAEKFKKVYVYWLLTSFVWKHHCENPVLGDFFVSSPKFCFPRGWGVFPLLCPQVGSARRRRAAYENFCEKFSQRRRQKMTESKKHFAAPIQPSHTRAALCFSNSTFPPQAVLCCPNPTSPPRAALCCPNPTSPPRASLCFPLPGQHFASRIQSLLSGQYFAAQYWIKLFKVTHLPFPWSKYLPIPNLPYPGSKVQRSPNSPFFAAKCC